MIKIAKTNASLAELDQVLSESHFIKIKVRMLDLDHNYIDDYSDMFVDGIVSVDADAEVTRALDLTLFDPFKRINLDPDSPGRTSVYMTNMFSIVFVVMNAKRTKTWEIPVFCGPVDDVQRDDVWLDIKCLGKESLSLANLWRGKTFKKNQVRTEVITFILRNLCGETRLSIPSRKAKMPNDKKLNSASKPWLVAKALAKTMGLQLFYDGRGIATLRKMPAKPVIRFGPKWITGKPKVAYDLSKVQNAVRVIGAKPKKAKHHVSAVAVAPKAHPLSPWRLGRGGVPRYLWGDGPIEDDSLRTDKECRDLAKQVLAQGLVEGTEVTWNGLPHPRLQEGDMAYLDNGIVQTKYRNRKFTIPLVAGDEATYGYLKRAKPRGGARAIRVRHKHHKNHHHGNNGGNNGGNN